MKNKSRTSKLSETVRAVHKKLLEWEQEIEHLKKSVYQPTASIENKKMAILLQYNATVKIARLGAELLERSMENRSQGLLLGLIKRPMFESYVRGMWFEHVADEKRAKDFLFRNERDKEKGWKTLKSEKPSPKLENMWKVLEDKDIEKETIKWMRDQRNWWNDSTHVTARSVWMGWSNEYGEMLQGDEQMINDLVALVEMGARCAGRIHALNEGDSAKEKRIHQEKQELRDIIEGCLDPE